MTMFATVYLPNFALQAATRHRTLLPSAAIALIDEQNKKPVVIQLNAAAASAGVHRGMTPSQALGRCLDVIITARSVAKEQSLADLVLQYVFALSPYVETTAKGIWTVQFHDNRDLKTKVEELVEHLSRSDVTAQAGIAPEPDSSFLAAHLARPVLHITDPKQYFAPLSIDILAIAPPA